MNWQEKEKHDLRERMKTHSYEKDGVLYWKSNDHVIPPFVYKDADIPCPNNQQIAYQKQSNKFVAEYREARKNYVPSEEEMFEMRAAFGPGETVVDIITGQKFRT